MHRLVNARFALIAAVGLIPELACAGAQTGVVNVVNVNAPWNGVMVQLNTPLGTNYESQCPGNWAFIPRDDPFYSSMLATLLAAKASGDTIVVYTSGCVQATVGVIARISVIDFGIRNGS